MSEGLFMIKTTIQNIAFHYTLETHTEIMYCNNYLRK